MSGSVGSVMFEVSFLVLGVMIYFIIGNYYKISLGFLLAAVSVVFYMAGASVSDSFSLRILIQTIPFFVMMYKQPKINIGDVKNKKICPVCGKLNELDADFCAAPRCDADLRALRETKKLCYYFPPNVITGTVLFVVAGSLLYEYTTIGRFILNWVYFLWPLLIFIGIISYFIMKNQ